MEKKKTRVYCDGNMAEVWRGKKKENAPKKERCPECDTERGVFVEQDGEEWVGKVSIHHLSEL